MTQTEKVVTHSR